MSAAGDIARVIIRYNMLGQIFINTLHFECVVGGTTLTSLLDKFTTSGPPDLMDLLRECLSSRVILMELKAEWVESADVDFETRVINQAGQRVSTSAVPLQSCTLVSLRTTLVGRSNRGRIFLPPPTGQQMEPVNGQWNLGHIFTVTTWTAALTAQFTPPTPWRWIVWSPVRRAAEGGAYVPPSVSTILVDNVPRTQRRRELFVGT